LRLPTQPCQTAARGHLLGLEADLAKDGSGWKGDVEALAEHAVADKIPHEMLPLDLYGALRQLDSLTGETTSDDILNLIFSSFCIGK
jgi:hypothetical protein